jgi:hypothetical protein
MSIRKINIHISQDELKKAKCGIDVEVIITHANIKISANDQIKLLVTKK